MRKLRHESSSKAQGGALATTNSSKLTSSARVILPLSSAGVLGSERRTPRYQRQISSLRAPRMDLEDAPLRLLIGQGKLDLPIYSASATGMLK